MQCRIQCDLEGFWRLETRGLRLHMSVRSKCPLRISLRDLSNPRAITYYDLHIRVSLTHLLHAVGHNLGGEHPFYDQELIKWGEIGGIMDYGP